MFWFRPSVLRVSMLILIGLLTSFAQPALAQTPPFPFAQNPAPGPVYADSTVPRVDIWIPADTLQRILSDVASDREWRARFRWQGNGLQDSVGLVGFRLKGNTSRYSGKKSFKVSFNTFVPGTRWQGLKDLNLNGEHNDPTIARARICWNFARQMGLAAARVNHVALYVNGAYFGVYANVEHMNDDYVDHRYGSDNGNLYKCLYPAPLQFLSTNPDAYKFLAQGRRAYELKTNTETDDYTDLARFIQVLNQTPDAQLVCALDTLLDINEYLLTLAVEMSLGHWDDYAVNNNNYYLYRSPHDGRFHFLLYDLDNTMGIDWFGVDWSSKNCYQWGNNGFPLYGRLMANAELRQRFTYYLKTVNDALYTPEFRGQILQIRDQIAPYALNDPYRPADYGYTFQQFNLGYTTATGAHVKEGILPYLDKRQQNTTQQLTTPTGAPLFRAPRVHAASSTVPVEMSTGVDGVQTVARVGWIWNADTSSPGGTGAVSDTAWLTYRPQEQRWAGSFLPPATTDRLSGRFWAQTVGNRAAFWPCAPQQVPLVRSEGLILNEIGARNPDFLEFFHSGSAPLQLGSYAVSDDSTGRNPYALPFQTVNPGERRCLDLSDTLVRPFGLSSNGEWVVLLYRSDSLSPYVPVDAIRYPSLPDNTTYARMIDGHPGWGVARPGTPCAANRPNAILPESVPVVYPNPHGRSLTVANPLPFPVRVALHSASGELLNEWTVPADSYVPLVDDFAPGFRFWIFTTDSLYLGATRTIRLP
jgi:spore coat protein CotH